MGLLHRIFGKAPARTDQAASANTPWVYQVILISAGPSPAMAVQAITSATGCAPATAQALLPGGLIESAFDALDNAEALDAALNAAGAQSMVGRRHPHAPVDTTLVLMRRPPEQVESVIDALIEDHYANTREEAMLVAQHGGVIDFNLDPGTAADVAERYRSLGGEIECISNRELDVSLEWSP